MCAAVGRMLIWTTYPSRCQTAVPPPPAVLITKSGPTPLGGIYTQCTDTYSIVGLQQWLQYLREMYCYYIALYMTTD